MYMQGIVLAGLDKYIVYNITKDRSKILLEEPDKTTLGALRKKDSVTEIDQ